MNIEIGKIKTDDNFFPFNVPLGMSDLKFMDLLLNTFLEEDVYSSNPSFSLSVISNGIFRFRIDPKNIVCKNGRFGVLADYNSNNQHINMYIENRRIVGFHLLGN